MSNKERLAAWIHDEQWSGWMKYLFSRCEFNDDGTATIPAWAVERWNQQTGTPYAELSEDEKDNDRREANRILTLLNKKSDLFYIVNTIDKGHWLMMTEGNNESMIIFTELSLENALHFKARFDAAISNYTARLIEDIEVVRGSRTNGND